jgi:hypothetical protein
MYIAVAHDASITPKSSTRVMAAATTTARMLISPDPRRGSRTATWDRNGNPRPRTTTTRKITRKAGMRLSPVMRSCWKKSVMSPP